MPPSTPGPRRTYERRLEVHRRAIGELGRIDARFSVVRLVLFAAAAALVWPALFRDTIAWWWILFPVAGFGVTAAWHARAIRRREIAGRAAGFYEQGLARLDHRWSGLGNPGLDFLDISHPYAADLDLFGKGSLFELLCAARTKPGETTLADWLCRPASREEVHRRQAAVNELRPMLDLREHLAVVGEDARPELDPRDLVSWARGRPVLVQRWPRVVAPMLGLVNVATLLAATVMQGAIVAFLVSATISGALAVYFRSDVRRVLAGVDRPERELELLSRILARLEAERFRSPLLVELRSALVTRGKPPSRRIAALARLTQINDSRRNLIFAPLAALLLLGTQFAFAVERWRQSSGRAVERWLRATGEIEALSSLAGYAYENPDDPFPEIVDGEPRFEGQELGHPLIPPDRCVRNGLGLGNGLQLLLVSGSNMSGKSTLLRTVGVNTVLALAGAPVRARSLRLSSLSIGASMRVQDSLQEGLSHFYAEIKRLRRIVDLGERSPPLLFLLDEILHGTNSHDRRVGAEALIRGLVEQGSIGLVTTHDLALSRIADELDSRAANVHFEDQLEGEQIVFDYKLRPGVVQRGNALALMRAIGLRV